MVIAHGERDYMEAEFFKAWVVGKLELSISLNEV